jgi:voltage-gated potassium channel
MNSDPKNRSQWRDTLYTVIFEAETPAGKWFDIILIVSILASVLAVMLDSISSVNAPHGHILVAIEWFFTIIFTIEYILRLICVGRPLLYATSFFGVVDLLAIIPTYISLFIPGSEYLLVVRILRILRIFRVLKLVQFMREALLLMRALRASARKIIVFLFTVLTLVVILGSLMYLIEGVENGFTSIPRSVYWAIVTLTTVGAAFIMILGYSIIAVPTGIVTVELSRASNKKATQYCRDCSAEGHDSDAEFCKYCGAKL